MPLRMAQKSRGHCWRHPVRATLLPPRHLPTPSQRVVPGYGGGMGSAKAQLESDTRTLAYEAGRKYGIRVNTISAGPLKSRAASAIGKDGGKTFIERAIDYSETNSAL